MNSYNYNEWRRRKRASQKRSGWPQPKVAAPSGKGYLYLVSSGALGVVKVGVSNRSSRFLTGRAAQHLKNGFEKVLVTELPTMTEAEVLEQDVLWLWSQHKLRRRP